MNRSHVAGVLLLASVAASCERGDGRNSSRFGTTSEPLTVCPTGSTVAGIDVSHFDGTIDWAQVAASGIQFAYAKATESTNPAYNDAQFAANWSGMAAHGVLRGAYHFFDSSVSGTTQADDFLAVVGTLGQPGDLPPMLDWESTTSGSTSADAVTEAQKFIDEIKAKTGLTTVIYTDPGFWEGLSGTGQFSAYPLWVANWSSNTPTNYVPPAGFCPDVPTPWSSWVVWQWSDTGTVPSLSAQSCDLDLFNGTLADLQAFGSGGSVAVDAGPTDAGPVTAAFSPPAQVTGNDSVTLVNWPNEHMELFARTPGGTELHSSTSGTGDTWAPLSSLGTGVDCGSAAAFWGGSWLYPDLFSPLSSGGTGHVSYTSGAWTAYQSLGGAGLSHFVTAITNSGIAEVFALGSDKSIWQNDWDSTAGAWSGWKSLGGAVTFATGIGAITWGNGTVELFGTDTSGVAWHMWSDSTGYGGWSVWTQFPAGGTLASRPVPVRWVDGTDGHAEVFARGTDGQLYHSDFSYTNDWPGFTVVSAGSQIIGEPSAMMNPGTAGATQGPEVFARNTMGQVVHVAWNGSAYGTFSALGNEVIDSDPFGWIRGDGAGEVFAVDTSGHLVHSYHSPSNGWTSWSSIGSGIDPCASTPTPGLDGGSAETDAGPATQDGGLTIVDAGSQDGSDAGPMERDAGSPTTAGDGGSTVSADGGGAGVPAGGCGCSAAETAPSGLLWVLLACGQLRRRACGAKRLD